MNMQLSQKDKVKAIALIIIIILSFSWTIKILIGTPVAKQIDTGTSAIKAGIPVDTGDTTDTTQDN